MLENAEEVESPHTTDLQLSESTPNGNLPKTKEEIRPSITGLDGLDGGKLLDSSAKKRKRNRKSTRKELAKQTFATRSEVMHHQSKFLQQLTDVERQLESLESQLTKVDVTSVVKVLLTEFQSQQKKALDEHSNKIEQMITQCVHQQNQQKQ